MDGVYEQVEKVCGQEMQQLADCVQSNSYSTIQKNCERAQQALTSCAETKVDAIRDMKMRCGSQIDAYETCVRGSPATPESCLPAFHALRECTSQL